MGNPHKAHQSVGEQLEELRNYQVEFGFDKEWPDTFVNDMWQRYEIKKDTLTFSSKQVDKINELWEQYCI